MLSTLIAVAGVAWLISVASTANLGRAPGNGEQVFDAPGCRPSVYDGPGKAGHYLLNRNCPRPTPVILRHASRTGGGWEVTWDGSRSFDPIGGRLLEYAWSVERGPRRRGRKISVRYTRPGSHSVVLYVTDDSGLTATAGQTVTLP